MSQMPKVVSSLALAIAFAATSFPVAAAVIDVSTNNLNWTASYATHSGAAYHYGCGTYDCISITSNGNNTGSFVGGGAAGDFTGTWSASLSFLLPADAMNVTLSYQSIGVDDRAVFSLNGGTIGTFYIFDPQISGSDSNPGDFLFGAMNTLNLAIVNNPFSQFGDPMGFLDAFDGTAVALGATLSYDLPNRVPEPATALLALFGFGLLGLGRMRRCPH